MNKKIVIFIFLFIPFIASPILALYLNSYNIPDKIPQLEKSIKTFINTFNSTLEIKYQLDLDNKKYILFLNNDSLGYSELTKGFNNKYKIETVTCCNILLRGDVCKTNKGKYIVLKGKNTNNEISYIKLYLNNTEYLITIPSNQEYFISYLKVPNSTDDVYIDFNKINIFNKNNINITKSFLN